MESLHAASEAVQTWTQSWESSMDSKAASKPLRAEGYPWAIALC